MATIGRAAAVVDLGWLRFSGFFAWLTWLFVHLVNLIQFGNRVLVLMQWAGNYFSRNRSARLITGENPLPLRR
jgi:NADH dehydrogenase